MRDDVPTYILSRSEDSAILAVNASMADLLRKIVAEHPENELDERLVIIAHLTINGQYKCELGDVEYNIKRCQLKQPIAWTK